MSEAWFKKARLLRPGDHIRASSWGGIAWVGGETLVVLSSEPTGLRDGYFDVPCYSLDCPESDRSLCMLADDEVTVVARDVVDKKPLVTLAADEKPVRKKKGKKGEQLKLF